MILWQRMWLFSALVQKILGSVGQFWTNGLAEEKRRTRKCNGANSSVQQDRKIKKKTMLNGIKGEMTSGQDSTQPDLQFVKTNGFSSEGNHQQQKADTMSLYKEPKFQSHDTM